MVQAKSLDTDTELASGCEWLATASFSSVVKLHLIAQPGIAAQHLAEGLSPTFSSDLHALKDSHLLKNPLGKN